MQDFRRARIGPGGGPSCCQRCDSLLGVEHIDQVTCMAATEALGPEPEQAAGRGRTQDMSNVAIFIQLKGQAPFVKCLLIRWQAVKS
jgi:hypothetical protein